MRNGMEEKEVRRIDSANLVRREEQTDEPLAHDIRADMIPPIFPTKSPTNATLSSPSSQVQMLKFLLSPAALALALPSNETTRNPPSRTYSDLLTPFEELLCAVILSHPIPHRLAFRTITTVLNAPYAFRNPVAIKTAGPKKIKQALQDAGMQRDAELDTLLYALCNNNWHNDISRLRAHTRNPIASQREQLRRSIAGLAPGGLDIFYRRVQWQWPEIYPFVDMDTHDALANLGLPRRAEGLDRMIEVRWRELELAAERGHEEDAERRRTLVMCCERARGLEREGKIEEVLKVGR